MNNLPMYKFVITDYFKKQLKRLIKKNRSLKETLIKSLKSFNKENASSIGMDVFKIRLGSQNKGKSGGYRLYIFVMEVEEILTPVCIYTKSEKENLSYEELIHHLIKTKAELVNLL